MKYYKELLSPFSHHTAEGEPGSVLAQWSEPGAISAKIESLTHVLAIHLRAGVNDPCGSFPIQNIWCDSGIFSTRASVPLPWGPAGTCTTCAMHLCKALA